MFTALFWAFVGMFVAWFFWPAPAWAQKVHAFLIEKLPFLGGGAPKE